MTALQRAESKTTICGQPGMAVKYAVSDEVAALIASGAGFPRIDGNKRTAWTLLSSTHRKIEQALLILGCRRAW